MSVRLKNPSSCSHAHALAVELTRSSVVVCAERGRSHHPNVRTRTRRLVPRLHNIGSRLAEDLGDTLERRIFGSFPPGALVDGGCKLRKHAIELAHRAAGEIAHRLADALEEFVEHGAVFRQEALAGGGDVVHTLPVSLHGADVALILE